MSLPMPNKGKGPDKEAENRVYALEGNGTKEVGSTRRKGGHKSQDPILQAKDDAQQGLEALLHPKPDNEQPRIISQSGAIRNQTRGRIAGPITEPARRAERLNNPASQPLIGNTSPTSTSLVSLGANPTNEPDETIRIVPNTRLGLQAARAASYLQNAREDARAKANLLIDLAGDHGHASLDAQQLHTSRRAAARWATRYATHMVILLVVGALVAMGGLRSLTVEVAYPQGLHAVDSQSGTDHSEENENEDPAEATTSPDFNIALPRTELGGADAVANSVVVEQSSSEVESGTPDSGTPDSGTPDKEQVATSEAPAPVKAITEYTVARGETIRGIAAKFDLMPETIMGANNILDVREALKPDQKLLILPVDGMYHVAKEGDTVESIARRYQADPNAILSYDPNRIKDGIVQADQPIVVPGGMLPARDTVITYTVKAGESLRDIASRFGVDVPTMLHSNDIPDADNLQVGSSLRVLPVQGIEHKVEKGETVRSIAERFGVSPQMILDYSPNGLTVESMLRIDQVIMVPGGSPEAQVMAARVEPSSRGVSRPEAGRPERSEPPKSVEKPVAMPEKPKSEAKPEPKAEVKPAPKPEPKPKPKVEAAPKLVTNTPKVGTGRMVWPIRGTITQYFGRRHNGLDIAIRAGTPIYAADAGKVIWSGWRTDGLGYCVIIDHGNGLTTFYGHMLRQPLVYRGQYVSRSQKIGLIGSTGRSTGPHVHFMVKSGAGRNYRNPMAYLGQ